MHGKANFTVDKNSDFETVLDLKNDDGTPMDLGNYDVELITEICTFMPQITKEDNKITIKIPHQVSKEIKHTTLNYELALKNETERYMFLKGFFYFKGSVICK